MLKFKWLITNALLRHGNEAKNQKLLLFYLFIARIHPILPNLINSTPGSSVNFHLVDIFTKPCISSNNLINISYSKTRSTLWNFIRQYCESILYFWKHIFYICMFEKESGLVAAYCWAITKCHSLSLVPTSEGKNEILQKRLRCGKSSEGVPGPPFIHSPPITCFVFDFPLLHLQLHS